MAKHKIMNTVPYDSILVSHVKDRGNSYGFFPIGATYTDGEVKISNF